jgi:hypothetical protein
MVAAAGAGGYLYSRSQAPGDAAPTPPETGTAAVVRTDLIQTETLAGSLRFAETRPVVAVVSGIVTALADEAAGLERGDTLYELDGLPVILFTGERPAWRAFVSGMSDGVDVGQLEDNLVALGYLRSGDGEFDDQTVEAIEAWRDDTGLPEGGGIELGRIVFLPGAVRVGARLVEAGTPVGPGTPLLEVSAPRQEVVIDLDPADLDLVTEGDSVVVILPDDHRIDGRISEVGRVVMATRPDGPEVVEVLVALATPVMGLDLAPVEVEVVKKAAQDVLAVPVRALLALSDGGYAVEVKRGGGTDLVGVETGVFSGGMVEVIGALEEGDQVVVPG